MRLIDKDDIDEGAVRAARDRLNAANLDGREIVRAPVAGLNNADVANPLSLERFASLVDEGNRRDAERNPLTRGNYAVEKMR
jgi:hypothetical protein